MDYDSDLIIVGSGAGGSTAFFENLNLRNLSSTFERII
jgi:hypothetical protein